jgi:hypothetical protein
MSDEPVRTMGDGVKTVKTTPAAGSMQDVNLAEVAGTATAVNNGPADNGTQRTATASDSPEVVSVASIDTKTPALGAAATAASTPVNIANDQNVPIQGDVAHDAVDSGNPVKIGGYATDTEPAVVANADRTNAVFTRFGALVIAAYDWITGRLKTSEGDPISQHLLNQTPNVDTTNETATTHYYPSATGQTQDGYSDFSATIKVIDGDGTVTITLEGTNDEDTTSGDWHDITTALGCDASNNPAYRNTTGNLSYTVTNGTMTLALSAPRLNYASVRWVAVFSGATNTSILKGRVKAL